MKSSARVVVIGGGVVGCSVLYHLAKNGWSDVMLIERTELTAGSSWHAAGGLFTITRPNTAAEIHRYTFQIYSELEKESAQSCGFHFTGGINICRTQDAGDCVVWGDEATFLDNEPVGYATAGGFGPTCEQHIALGYVNCDAYRPGGQYTVEVLGQLVAAELQTEALYDPTGAKMRA